MRERGLSFKEVVNAAIRQSGTSRSTPFRTETASMGEPQVNVDRALQLAAWSPPEG